MTCFCGDSQCLSCGAAQGTLEPIQKDVEVFAEELADAYSSDNYGNNWGPCIKALRLRDYTDRQH